MSARLRAASLGIAVLGGVVLMAGVLTGCSSSSASSSAPTGGAAATAAAGTGHGRLGSLRVIGAYIPAQASPAVAAGYFTVVNAGGTADALTAVRSPVASTVQMHDTTGSGGVESMTPIKSLAIPAHGSASFTLGHRHIMLVKPAHLLTAGEHVPLTLVFRHAGSLTLSVPVVAATGPGPMPMGSDMTMPTGR